MRPLLTLTLLSTLTAANRTPVPAVETKPHPCSTPGLSKAALCATYPVWEDRDHKSGRKIGLNILILPALNPEKSEPVFAFGGGPGEAITEAAPGYAFFRAIRAHHDIVMIDQRGTGGSNPLECDFYGNPPDLQRVVTSSFPVDAVRACRERLEKIADLRLYTTAIAMDDIDEVRAWLGYEKINLEGGSYGSLAAQVYLRRHGQHVRAAALGGIVPPDELHPLHVAWAGQRAIDIIFDKCRADATCHAAYPNLPDDLKSIFARVKKGIEVEVRAPDGRSARVHPSVEALAEGIRHSLYSSDGSNFPQLIHRAASGDFAPLIQKAVSSEIGLANALAMGMLLSVTCAEQIPYIDDATLARETANTFLGDLRVQEQRAACQEWPRGPVPKDVHDLVHSQVPVLLISGARDAVTPPTFGDRVAAQLPNSRHIIFPESSHGNWGFCGTKLMSDFLEKGSTDALDTSCVSQQKPPKFKVDP
ncbi:MAG TPA: alpha/beta fold hydrolase [Bryobacteraceae bacterium]|jgi:pimeloyl-ACP methyl ester carboxylesterase|nr:alpha/beta fold hydrolase [Bryobacteraceae bacterium]